MLRTGVAVVVAGALAAQDPVPTAGPAAVRVHVVDPHGGPVPDYVLQLVACKASTEGEPGQELRAERAIAPHDLTGDHYLLRGVPVGSFLLRIDAEGFAHTLSTDFTTAAGAITDVTVCVTSGGHIEGTVLDPEGHPVANADVRTDPMVEQPKYACDDFFSFLRAIATTSSGANRTDAHGHYRLDHLAPGSYTVRIHDPSFCDALVRDLPVADGKTMAVGDVRLESRVVVEGIARKRQKEKHEFWVRVEVWPEPGAARSEAPITAGDAEPDGAFRLPGRLRPGTYEVIAHWGYGHGSALSFNGLPLRVARQRVTVLPGQRRVALDLEIEQ